jgi:PTS system glucitol/sorbitol-specific IIB component
MVQKVSDDAGDNVVTNDKKASTPEKSYGKFDGVLNIIEKIGRLAGYIVSVFYQSARESVNMMIKNVIPFMVFLALMNGIITKSGVGNTIAVLLKPLTGSVGGLIIFALIIGFPFLSPLLGPGAVIQSILGVFIGTSISQGIVPVNMALPALFAISVVDACDFIPVAASLGEADPDTARIAVPAMLFSRFITAPIAVLIGYVFSIGLF